MGFERPSFIEMKGHAVAVMNHLAKAPDMAKHSLPVLFPVELKNIHGHQVLLVNESSGLICLQGIPREVIRDEDAGKPHNEDAWAFALLHIVREPKKIALQKQIFPQLAPYVHVIEVFVDWQEAVYNAVMQAAANQWTINLHEARAQDESTDNEQS